MFTSTTRQYVMFTSTTRQYVTSLREEKALSAEES